MRRPVVVVIRAAGARRAVIVAAASAVAGALLLVGASYLRVPTYSIVPAAQGGEQLISIALEGGTRQGVLAAFGFSCIPLYLLVDQAARLGSVDRERRYGALRLAGATRRDLRLWGAVELALPALAGTAIGALLWLALRVLLGAPVLGDGHGLVPSRTGPGWYAVPVVAVIVAVASADGMLAAARATSATRGADRPPRPWGLLLLPVGVMIALQFEAEDWGILLAVIALVAGLVTSVSWLGHVVAGRVARNATAATSLMAARRVMAHPRELGGAAAAAGAAAMALSSALGLLCNAAFTVLTGNVWRSPGILGTASALLGLSALATVAVAGSVAVRCFDTVAARRRELAALVANGVGFETIEESLRAQVQLVVMPTAILGAIVVMPIAFLFAGPLALVTGALAVVVLVAGTRFGLTRLRPALRRILGPESIRTA